MKWAHLICISCCSTTSIFGMWLGVDAPHKVPINRVVANLESRVLRRPTNDVLLASLARCYSMIYGTKVDTLLSGEHKLLGHFIIPHHEVVPGQLSFVTKAREKYPGTFRHFGTYWPDKDVVAKNVKEVASLPDKERNKQYLTNAIHYYSLALASNPKNAFTQLGLGWCLQENGDTNGALLHYRTALNLAEGADKDYAIDRRWRTFSSEVSWYIRPLLDPIVDKHELEKLKRHHSDSSDEPPRKYTPMAVPLKQGLKSSGIVNQNATVIFDLDGTGPAKWTWITPDAGWIVYDHDGKGQITSGLQLFGNVTFWLFWENGYEALASLDDDQDGSLSGEELRRLSIWQDLNSNGISEPGEVRPVGDWGIVELNTSHSMHENIFPWSEYGVKFKDGSVRPSYDFILERR